MNSARWLLLALMVVSLVTGCEPVVEIRVMTDRDLAATSLAANAVTSTVELPTAVPDTPAATANPSPTEIASGEEGGAITTPLATITPSPSPTASRLPTPTRSRPTATTGPGSDATRIRFRTGASSATVSGQLDSHDSKLYVLGASAGQILQVTVVSPTAGVALAIWGEDGTVLKQYAENQAECVLPSSQDYFVGLYSAGQAVRYELIVTIPPLGSSGLTRIQFAPGATSGVVEGRLEPGACAHYMLGALAGQRMEVQVSPGEVVNLEMLGQDGSLWSSGPGGTLIVERLPRTGDYYLTLCTPSWADATRYTMEVIIPPR